jgi:hypothetical protein
MLVTGKNKKANDLAGDLVSGSKKPRLAEVVGVLWFDSTI